VTRRFGGFAVRRLPDKMDLPLKWKKPRKIFVNSMSDFFHEDIPLDYLSQMADVMQRANWH
jgi:protein gp37